MKIASRTAPTLRTGATHRTYRDQRGTETAVCQQITTDAELLRLASGATRIELRQAPGTGWIPTVMTDPIVQALRSIDLVSGSADPRAQRLEREIRRRLTDALARIRVRHNRYLFAGVTEVFADGEEERVLVLVFARRGVSSCEWKIAA